jgi:hypothetical protein
MVEKGRKKIFREQLILLKKFTAKMPLHLMAVLLKPLYKSA